MTAALRGFNMELNEASAQRVNDVYSNLAANAAANTHEIADAMTRTASIANAAGMEFETTAAFLTQMIETTRESAENLGTAMKTIVARFTEMKKAPTDIINVEGEEISVNKVEAALKSVGVELRNTTGEFRDLDDVFLELASKWDSLDVMSQRYVATMAAGSRQQSRFIAMMSNYQRTMELTGYATNSAGASQRQFEKTMESLESKLNRLHNAWEQFTTGIANASIIKGAVDLLTNLLTTVNKITDALDPLNTGWAKTLTAILAFKAGSKLVNSAFKNIGTQIAAGLGKDAIGKAAGEKTATSFIKGFKDFFNKTKTSIFGDGSYNIFKDADAAAKEAAAATKEYKKAQEDLKVANEAVNAAQSRYNSTLSNSMSMAYESLDTTEAYTASQEIAAGLDESRIALKEAETVQIAAETAAEQAENTMKEKNIIATEGQIAAEQAYNNTSKLGLINRIKVLAMAAFSNKEKKIEILRTYGLITAEQAEAVAKGEMTIAQISFNTALLSCPLTWILAGLAALVAIVAIVAINMDTTAKKSERLNKAVEQLGSQMQETQETINDLTDSWDKLSGLKDDLDDLTIGTIEWKKKLIEVNQEVLNLLDKYPQLAQYVSNNDGLLEISSSGYGVVLDKQLESLVRQQQAYSFGQALAAKTDQQLYNEESKAASTYTSVLNKREQANLKGIESAKFFETATANLAKEYTDAQEKIGDKLTEQEQTLISTVTANKQSLKRFEEIKNKTKADTAEYARLTGLTKEQVENKKEQKELDEESIKTLIATYKYQQEYNNNTRKLLNLSRGSNIDNTIRRAISGDNALITSDLKTKNGKAIQDIFVDFIKDGILNIEDEDIDKVKKLFIDNFNIDENTIDSLTDLGISLEDIIQHFINSEKSLQDFNSIIANFNDNELTSFNKIKTAIENISKTDLSTEQLKQLGLTFEEIKKQGGNIETFSTQISKVISQLKNPEDVQTFLNTLKNVDFSSETKIREFTDNLSDLGITIGEDVKSQIVDATNAARDFDLSKIVGQLRNFELTEDVQSRKADNDRKFTKEEFEEYNKDLTNKGYLDLLDSFKVSGSGYSFIGNWDDLENAVLANEEAIKAQNQYEEELVKNTKRTNDLLEAESKYGTAPENAETKNIWNNEKMGAFKPHNLDLNTPGGIEANYIDSLLYAYNESGEIITKSQNANPYIHDWMIYDDDGKQYDIKKINALINALQQDQSLITSIPQEVIDFLYNNYNAIYEASINNRRKQSAETRGYVNNSPVLDSLIGQGVSYMSPSLIKREQEKILGQLLGKNSDIPGFYGSNWSNTQLLANEKFLKSFQEIIGSDVLSDKQIEELKNKTRDEIEQFIKSLNFSENPQLTSALEEWSKTKYQGLTSAREIMNLSPENELEVQAQKDAIDVLITQHSDYEARLKSLQTQLGLTTDAAKQYLAIQYEQEAATDSIKGILSDYTDTLNEENLSSTKGTEDYYNAIEALVEKFKILFGENITQEWVEKNLSTIRELDTDDIEAVQKAMDKLAATSEAAVGSINTANTGDANGKIDETIFGRISESLSNVRNDIDNNSEKLTSDFEAIKTALTELDGSEATIQIKENTRAKTMVALQNVMAGLLAKKLLADDPQEISALEAKLQTLKNLASSVGFSVKFADSMTSGYTYGGATLKWDSNEQRWVDIKDKSSNDALVSMTDLRGEKVGVPASGIGSGITTNNKKDNSSDKTSNKTKEDTWENDYDAQYNALKKIEALDRKRTELEREQSRLTKRRFIDEQALMKNKQEQVKLLKQQAAINAELARSAESYLRGSGNGDVWYDTNTGTIQTNPNAAYYNEEQMEVFNKQLKMMEGYYDQMKSAKDNLADIYEQIEDLTEVISELTDPTYNFDRIVEVLDNTLKNLEREITHLERTDSGATAQEFRRRYEQSAQTYVDKYNQDTNKKAIQEQQLNSLIYSDYSKYFTVDWATKQLTRTATYAGITDPEMQKSVDTIISQAQELCNGIIELDDDQKDIEDSLYDLKKNLADKALEFQEKVYEAVVHAREQAIENLKNIDTSINNAASELISSIQKNIQKIRQDRNNKKTEEELSKMQSRLDFLRMDTSSGNQKTILDLEKQLEDKEQSYTDSLIDQKISELQDQNTEAEKQRKRQIEIMETQLELSKENGAIWKAVDSAIKTGFNSSGRIQKGSDLYNMLSSLDEVTKKNSVQFERWFGELNNLAAAYNANLTADLDTSGQMSNTVSNANDVYGENSEYIKSLKSRLEAMNRDGNFNHLMWYDQEGQKMVYKYSHYYASSQTEADAYNKKVAEYQALARELANARAFYKTNKNASFVSAFNRLYGYDTGGLADYTGLAWLDGTPTSPEMVLSSKDTENFIQLKDILSNVMNGETGKNNNTNGDYYFEIAINVDKVTSDYDVDQIADRIKQQISDSARYRNVNVINLLR